MDLGREPLNQYGSLAPFIQQLHDRRPLELSSGRWREANPHGSFADWREQAKQCLRDGLHYDAGPLNLAPETIERRETDDFVCERIVFNTSPWFRVPGYFYVPKNVPLPAPALVVFHEWGGPMLFGAERVCGEPVHPVIVEHRNTYTSGRALADWYAAHGYCVIVIDAYHFGHRAPRALGSVPDEYDPRTMSLAELKDTEALVRDQLYLGVRHLNWAGTTWCGVNFADDSRCVDYLLSRPEVDGQRLGCTGLSGGGWRTNIMAALEDRIQAAVSVGWMTTGETQQRYNVAGAVGTFCLLPGVWDQLDIPDLIAMAAPKACMVVSCTQDPLFAPKGQGDAAAHIAAAYDWAGCPARYRDLAPDKPHCYDAEIQEAALAWFAENL